MSRARIQSVRDLLFSNTSTVAVGSSWASSVVDVSNYKSFVGICRAASGNMAVALDQGALSTAMDVSSGLAFTPGTAVYSWTAVGRFAQLRITSVTSFAGDMRLHVFGVPI